VKAKKRENKPGKIFIISGPSGSGKTTLLSRLIQDKIIGKLLAKSRSVTTRPKRLGERQGKDYFFVTPDEFKRLLKAKKILEWTRYLGYYYGTPKEPVENRINKGKHLGLCLDLKGAAVLKKIYPRNTVTVFILPPSLNALKARIEGRCRETNKKEITQRLRLAKEEILAAAKFDYCILNQNLRIALWELKNIFLKENSV
jgi:guanylate kinase